MTNYDILKEYEAHKTPVPSYDRVCRLNHLENDFIKAHERINKLEKEKQQLKELLKECRNKLKDCLCKLYDEGGQSYNSLEPELQELLARLKGILK